MQFKVATALLTLSLAAASALPYDLEWENRYYWKEVSPGRVARTQAAQDKSACVAVTESKNDKRYRVLVCTADETDTTDESKVCLGTRVRRCCPERNSFPVASLLSTTTINVSGEYVTLSYYTTTDKDVCYRIDDNHLKARTCSAPATNEVDCLPQCGRASTACFDNTITGDSSSCTNDQCNCKPKYLPPDCCKCDTRRYYLPDCKEFCQNCNGFRPIEVGGCASCREGWIAEPECCLCDQVGNETHAFYRSVDGRLCLPFCKQNCAVRGERGCDSCKVGYVSKPECCDCDTTGNETHAFYRTPDGRCLSFCKQNCAVIGERGCDSCKVGYVSKPECCDCDTIGNDTHAFYRASDGRCLPFCKKNCADKDERGCNVCNIGYVSEPECCDCDTTGNETHAFYRTAGGKCLPFCKQNCAVRGERGCESCKVGYVSKPECCDCDTTGNETHAFYKALNGKCLPFCRQNCALPGKLGCDKCKEGFESVPDCCQSTKCNKDQDLYFLIDATSSNKYFCQVISVLQVLVATFNPSSSSETGTKIMAWLFGNGESAEPSPVANSGMNCNEIVNGQLRSLISEFEECLEKHGNFKSTLFRSLCGRLTSAVSGLEKIAAEIESRGTSRNRAMVILTDGIIKNEPEKLKTVFSRFGDTKIIGGGIQDADFGSIKEYIRHPNDNIKVKENPIDLGLAIVDRLSKTGVLCPDHATNITEKLDTARKNSLAIFCQCHLQANIDSGACARYELKRPKCGGDLTFGAFTVSKQSWELEEEILAAVESVLENYSG